jgi:general stress protein 26
MIISVNRIRLDEQTRMMKQNYYTSLFLSVLLLIPFPGHSQNKVLDDSTNYKIIKAAREIMTAAGICTLITLDEEGVARARAMDAFPADDNFIIWFGTNPKSRKVKQIEHDSRVTLYYFDKPTASYVMIHGNAEIMNSREVKENHWKEAWQNFYPDYPENYLLIKVTPEWLEVISEARGISGDPITWQPTIVRFKK